MADDVNITIGATLENLNASVAKVKSLLNDLTAAFGVAISIDALKNLVEGMARLGEETERTASILGVTSAQVQQLGFLAEITGGNAQQFVTSLERMQLGLERGQRATSQQAAAFNALGISVSQLTKASPDKQVMIIADAVKRLSDQGINAAPALMLINRGLANMYPVLQLGSQGIIEWESKLKDVGGVVTPEVTRRLAELEKQLTLTKASFTGLAEVLVSKVAGSFETVADSITHVIGRLTLLSQTGNLSNYFSTLFSGVIEQMKRMGPEGMGGVAGGDEVQNQIRQVAEDTHAALAKIINAALGQFDAAIKAGTAKTPLGVDLGAASERMKVAEAEYQETVQLINAARDAYQGSEADKTRMLIQAAAERRDAEIRANGEVAAAWAKYNAQIAKDEADLTKKIFAEWKGVADSIAGAFNSQLDAILSGTESFAEGMRKTFASMIEDMIKLLIKLFTEWLTLDAISMAMGGGPVPFSAVLPTVGKFQEGSVFVPQTGLALIHRGEAIIPAQSNPFAGGNTTNMGGHVSLHVNAIDARSVANMFFNNRAFMAQLLNLLARNNPSIASKLAGSV